MRVPLRAMRPHSQYGAVDDACGGAQGLGDGGGCRRSGFEGGGLCTITTILLISVLDLKVLVHVSIGAQLRVHVNCDGTQGGRAPKKRTTKMTVHSTYFGVNTACVRGV